MVKAGPEVEVSFRFKNTGDKPLIISDVHSSCGCTIPEKPEQPYQPGDEGTIKAKFTTEGHIGSNQKIVYVTANVEGKQPQELTFHIQVEKE